MINENSKLISRVQLKEHVHRLNKGEKGALSTEWEIVILNALSKLGNLRYEEPRGGTYPDLFFTSTDVPNMSFLADIITVSDEGYEDANPINDFRKEFVRILRKNDIKRGGFHYEIGSVKGKRSMMLKIPPKGQFNTFFKSLDFSNFITRISKNPALPQSLNFASNEAEIKIYYDPKRKYFSGGHASYNTVHSLTKNPIYNALKAKAQRLKETGYKGTLSIFLCDGGCNLLTSSLYDWQSYNLNDVINEFFRQYSSVHFILTFAIKEKSDSFLDIRREKSLEVKIFSNPTKSIPSKDLLDTLNKFVNYLPIPANTVINAAHRVKNRFEQEDISFYGGSTETNKTIKISSRGLLELLSGGSTKRNFFRTINLRQQQNVLTIVIFLNLN